MTRLFLAALFDVALAAGVVGIVAILAGAAMGVFADYGDPARMEAPDRTPVGHLHLADIDPPSATPLEDRRRRVAVGQSLAEYGLVFGLVVIVAILAVAFLSGNVSALLSSIGHSV